MSDNYAALKQAIDDYDHESVKKATNEILSIDQSDKIACATQAKFISLIKTKKFDEAVKFANSQPKLKQGHLVEIAYALHRQDKNKEALDLLKKIP